MISIAGNLAAPFPWFGGKSNAAAVVWSAFGEVDNYVEPFAGSLAVLLGSPEGRRVETVNDLDGFVANFWRAIKSDPDATADAADWPCNENDLFARHSWLVRQRDGLTDRLHADPEYFDAKIAGWWCWGACNWIGSGWCEGTGPWVHDGERLVKGDAGMGVNRKLPHLSAGRGVNRKLPHLGDAGKGDTYTRRDYILDWFRLLHDRLRDVRVACGDWQRVCKDSVTTRHGTTGLFLDPPYTRGEMQYAAGGMRIGVADDVRNWCVANGDNRMMRIVLCGHAHEHDMLLDYGWRAVKWTARKGYAMTDEAVANSASETVWCSPACVVADATEEPSLWT